MKVLVKVAGGVVLAAVLTMGGMADTASADVLLEHIGANDPATEDWTAPSIVSGVTTGSLADDGGFPAWFIDDNSTAIGGAGAYLGTPADTT